MLAGHFIFISYLFAYCLSVMCLCLTCRLVHIEVGEQLGGSVVSVHCGGPGDQTRAVRLDGKCLPC